MFDAGNRFCATKYSGGGGVEGFTVTWKLQFVLVSQVSLAVQVTVVVPTGKVLPLDGLKTTLGAVQPPVAELVNVTVAPLGPVAVTVIFDEQVRTIAVDFTHNVPFNPSWDVSQASPGSRAGRIKFAKLLE